MRIDFPAICQAAGIQSQIYLGWEQRASGESGYAPRAWMIHHDASGPGPSPGVGAYLRRMLDSDQPAAPLWLDYAGVMHIIGWGPAYHAGIGAGCGPIPKNDGNDASVGIETDHTVNEAWAPGQLDALIRFLRAGCVTLGWHPLTTIWGHKEYAPGRKIDPANLDMGWLRHQVVLGGTTPEPPVPPEPPPAPVAPPFPFPSGHWMGMRSSNPKNHSGYLARDKPGVAAYQRQMRARGWNLAVDGIYGQRTADVTRAFQAEKGLTVDGLAGEQTWNVVHTAPVT